MNITRVNKLRHSFTHHSLKNTQTFRESCLANRSQQEVNRRSQMESTKVWAPHSLHRIPLAGPNWRPDGKRVTTDRAQQVQPLRAQNMREKGEEERIGRLQEKILSLVGVWHYLVIRSLLWGKKSVFPNSLQCESFKSSLTQTESQKCSHTLLWRSHSPCP